jgi:GTP cyclohydrolase I
MENNEELNIHRIQAELETPMRDDAFDLTDDQKIDTIEGHFKEIMHTLGLDLKDDSLKNTPRRVAKMYVKEIFSGLNPANKPTITLFENKYGYNQMLVVKDISLYSMCEHHFVPIFGKAHVGYMANGNVIGLSKLHRLVKYYAKRPQVQERMTKQIAEAIKSTLKINDVAVIVEARHMCVECRGVEDTNSTTVTSAISGQFLREATRNEFTKFIGL